MVDAVILWVDGSDPIHCEKRRAYRDEADNDNTHIAASDATRFADCNELWYSINLLRKNAPWIDQIFLVTDNQKPKWLSPAVAQALGVSIVDHTVIFGGMEECLPTFNSDSIECVMHRVPGLSEQFLCLNDDFFVVRPIKYNDYFDLNTVKARGDKFWRIGRFRKYLPAYSPKAGYGYNAFRGGKKNMISKWRFFKRGHAPMPILKSRFEQALPDKDRQANARFRFRDARAIQPVDAFYNIALKEGFAEVGAPDWEYCHPAGLGLHDVELWLKQLNINDELKTVCIQSLDTAYNDVSRRIFSFLDSCIETTD